jgi:hypothetical protein
VCSTLFALHLCLHCSHTSSAILTGLSCCFHPNLVSSLPDSMFYRGRSEQHLCVVEGISFSCSSLLSPRCDCRTHAGPPQVCTMRDDSVGCVPRQGLLLSDSEADFLSTLHRLSLLACLRVRSTPRLGSRTSEHALNHSPHWCVGYCATENRQRWVVGCCLHSLFCSSTLLL